MEAATPRRLTVLAVAVLVAAVLIPLAATPAHGAPDRCLDFEFVSPTVVTDTYEDDPLFAFDETPTVHVRVQLTDGPQLTTDNPGVFDCAGTGLNETLTLSNSGPVTLPATVDTSAADDGMSPAFAATINDTSEFDQRIQVSTSSTGPSTETTFAYHYWWWGDPGYPGGIDCVPGDFVGVPGETREFLVTATDSWGDVVPGAPIDLVISGTHPQTLLDNALTDQNGQVASSYVSTSTGSDFGECWSDGNDNDTQDYGPPDGGYGSAYATWVTAGELQGADVEADADDDAAPQPYGAPADLSTCPADHNNDLNDGNVGGPLDGLGNTTDDTYDQSRTGLPLNGVVAICVAGETGTGTLLFGREATLSITAGPGELVDLDATTSLGSSTTALVNVVDGAYPHALFLVRGLAPGTTTLRASIDGVTDTDTITLGWDAPAVADARVLDCTGGGWTQIPASVDVDCTVTDGLGNGVAGVTVDFARTDSEGASTTTPTSAVTNGSGKVSRSLASATEGQTHLTASIEVGDCDPPAPADGPGGFDVGKPAAACEVEVPIRWSDDAPPTTVDLDPGDVGTGDDQVLTVTVTDADGAPVDSVKVCVVISGANAGTFDGMTDDDGNVSFDLPTTTSGDDVVEVYADLDGDAECDATAVLSESVQRNGVIRFAGDDRRLTAILASQERFQDHAGSAVRAGSAAPAAPAGAVVLARQDVFADALAGTPLAAANAAPLLLTPTAQLHADTLAEIDRVLADGGTVYLLGGEAALSSTVADALDDRWTVQRIGGDTRFHTAVMIADATTATPSTVLVTTGTNFADALTAGAAAAAADGVVVLSGDSVPVDVTTAYLDDHGAADLIAVGGPAARGYPTLDAIVGDTRFDTGLQVANAFFDAPTEVGIARGYAFPDGLSGGAHIGNLGGPLLLVRGTDAEAGLTHPDNTDVVVYLQANSPSLHTAYIYGGAAAVAEVITDQLLSTIS